MPFPAGFEAMVFRESLIASGIQCGPAEQFNLMSDWAIPIMKPDGSGPSFILPVHGGLRGERPAYLTRAYSWILFIEYRHEGDPTWKSRRRMWPHSEEVFIGMFTTLWTPPKRKNS